MEESIYGVNTRQANAFLNRPLPGSEDFWSWGSDRGLTMQHLIHCERIGAHGRLRKHVRCTWPLTACPGAPICTAKHIDGDAQDAAEAA